MTKEEMSNYVRRTRDFIFKQKCIPWSIRSRVCQQRLESLKFQSALGRNQDCLLKLNVKVFSFDIFDTVLTRQTSTPAGIFALMQNSLQEEDKGLPEQLANNFCSYRMKAEEEARHLSSEEEITLEAIYATLAQSFNLPHTEEDRLKELEIAYELENIRPVPVMQKLLKTLRSHNCRIVFVSDMYLPKDVIKQMLVNSEILYEGDGLYVSSDIFKVKSSGGLFRHVLRSENCSAKELVHIGDNILSDVITARKCGLRSFYFDKPLPNRYEQILRENGSIESLATFEIIAGAAKMARISQTSEDTRKTVLNDLGASVAGPILVSYVSWLLQKAQNSGVQRLYFVSRDGQILLDIAKRISERLGVNIELRYLYGSRQAWFFPAITDINEQNLSWMLEKSLNLSFRMIGQRISIDPEIIQEALYKKTQKRKEIDQALTHDEIEKLKGIFKNSPLGEMISKKAEVARNTALTYFRQEGLMDDNVHWGIVDIGWKGRLETALKALLDMNGNSNQEFSSFYFGLTHKNAFCANRDITTFAYLFTPHTYTKELKALFESGFINILEVLTAADHGTVISYRTLNDGRSTPVLKEETNSHAIQWGLGHLREGIVKFTDNLSEECIRKLGLLKMEEDRKWLHEMIRALVYTPGKEEAEVLGDHPFNADQAETYSTKLAKQLTIAQISYVLFTKSWRNSYKEKFSFWIEGSLARSSKLAFLVQSEIFKKLLIETGRAYSRVYFVKD